jgi:TPR repeat protein
VEHPTETADALQLLEGASTLPRAAGSIGMLHEKGLAGLPENIDRAIEWYKKAAAGRDPPSLNHLAALSLTGKLDADQQQVREWLETAAGKNQEASYNLARFIACSQDDPDPSLCPFNDPKRTDLTNVASMVQRSRSRQTHVKIQTEL